MADKRIDQLTAATTMGDDDLLVLQQNNQAKKLPGSVLSDYVYDVVEVSNTQPTESRNKVWIKPSTEDLELAEMSDLNEIKNAVYSDLEEIQFVNDYYITCSADPVDISSPTASEAGWRYAVVDCNVGDMFTITGAGGSDPRFWCFIDSDGNSVEVANASVTGTDMVLITPKRAVKLIVNDNTGGHAYKGTKLHYLTNKRLGIIKNAVLYKNANSVLVYCADPTKGETYSTEPMPLPETLDGKIHHNGYGNTSYYSIMFFDDDLSLISAVESGGGMGHGWHTDIPANAKYFMLGNMNSVPDEYEFYAGFSCTLDQWGNYLAVLSNHKERLVLVDLLAEAKWENVELRSSDGSIYNTGSNYNTTDFIELPNNRYIEYVSHYAYASSGKLRYGFYDSSKTFISGGNGTSKRLQHVAIPENAKYVRIGTHTTIPMNECLAYCLCRKDYSNVVTLNEYNYGILAKLFSD